MDIKWRAFGKINIVENTLYYSDTFLQYGEPSGHLSPIVGTIVVEHDCKMRDVIDTKEDYVEVAVDEQLINIIKKVELACLVDEKELMLGSRILLKNTLKFNSNMCSMKKAA